MQRFPMVMVGILLATSVIPQAQEYPWGKIGEEQIEDVFLHNDRADAMVGANAALTIQASNPDPADQDLLLLKSAESIVFSANAEGDLHLVGDLTVNGILSGELDVDAQSLFVDPDTDSVGIGTDAPAAQLELEGEQPEILFDDSVGDDFKISNDNGLWRILNTTDGRTDFTLDGNGRFGFGETAPAEILHLDGDAAKTQILIDNSALDGDPVLGWRLPGVRTFIAGIDDSDEDKWKIAGAGNFGSNEFLIVTTDGRVGLKDSSPDEDLDVHGDIVQDYGGSTDYIVPVMIDSAGNTRQMIYYGTCADGSVNYTNDGFPVAFKSGCTPIVTITLTGLDHQSGTEQYWYWCQLTSSSNTGFAYKVFRWSRDSVAETFPEQNNDLSGSATVHWRAMGWVD